MSNPQRPHGLQPSVHGIFQAGVLEWGAIAFSAIKSTTTLQKTAEYIAMLQQERAAKQEEAQQLRDQIEELNAAIK